MSKPQTIEVAGQTFVLVPADQYEDFVDIADAYKALSEGSYPDDITQALIDGTSPIKAWRKYRGKTLAELAAAADITPSYISDIENGKKQGAPDTLKRIADALKIKVDDII